MPLFRRSRKDVALSPAPGGYSEEDPEKVIFDRGTRLRVEANHWKMFCFVLAFIAGGAVWTRQPPPSVVKSYGIAADAGVSMSTIFDGPMIIENDGRSAKQVQLTAMARRRQKLDNTIAGVTDA